MAKKTYTTQSVETYALLNRLERQLTDLFGSTYEGALKIAAVRKAIAAGESFTFDENRPETKQLIKSLSIMAGKADRLLADSVTLAWQEGEESVTNACYSAFGSIKGSKEAVRAIADRSREDLRKRGVSASAFYNRQHGGLTISDRVWNIAQSGKSEIEEIIQQGVLQGKSAAEISRSVRSYLLNPNKLFRRVRNKETGELELSRNARNYHPGRGVYRSSCQNAMRLARTEVNAAYRRAEWESYQNNPLITGYRIQLSNNHTIKIKGKAVAFHDICDELAGDYPKTFQWTGWHPQCRCRMIPIFLTEGDFRARIRALAAGKLDTWKAGNTVTQLPEAFTGWVKANTDRIKSAKQVPFFILDNYKGGDPTKGLVDTITSLKQQVKESAKVQPVTEYDGELADLEKWSATFELDTTQTRILREAGDKAGMKKEIERLQDLKDERSTEWLTARTRLRIFADKLKEYPEYTKYDNILQQYEIKPQGPTWKEAVQKLKDAANQARADFDKRLKEKEAEKQKAQAAAAAAAKKTAEEQKAKNISADQYEKELKDKLGITKGEAMSFEEANQGKGNVHFVPMVIKDETGKKILNPAYTKDNHKYHINCQSCVVAHELRLRGWDVTAQGNTPGSIPEKLSYQTHNAWRTDSGSAPTKERAGGAYFDGYKIKSKTRSVMLKEFAELTKEPGRYHIDWAWKGGKSGHIITCERLPNGKLRIYDPQNGEIITDFATYAKEFSLRSGIRILRVDNLRVNLEWIADVVNKN